jgi:hypothetical protein
MKLFKESIKNIFSEELINEIEQICDEIFESEKEFEQQTFIEQSTK